MGKKVVVVVSVVLSAVSIFFAIPAAFGSGNTEDCTSPSATSGGDTYSCVSWSGYVGQDGYHVDRFSTPAPDGSLHSCTSFAAHMLWHENTHFSQISTFDSAQYWDNDASVLPGVVVSTTPHVGDIAQWEKDANLQYGHVALVTNVVMSNGKVLYINTADDNAGRQVTTTKVLFPGTSNSVASWPDHFITFPGFSGIYYAIPLTGGGGGKPPVALGVTPATN